MILNAEFWAQKSPLYVPGFAARDLCASVLVPPPEVEPGYRLTTDYGFSPQPLQPFIPCRVFNFESWQVFYRNHNLYFHHDNLEEHGREGLITSVICLDGVGQLTFRNKRGQRLVYPLTVGDALFWHGRFEAEGWEHGGPCGQRTSLVLRYQPPR